MHTLVIYDIPDDGVRVRVSDLCKRFGLARIQKSAFLGDLSSSVRKELVAALRRVLGERDGNIQVFVICRADLSLRTVIGKPFHEYTSEAGDLFV
ncbi:CRISPR-associated endonuclease Cas2 [Candidatus Bathyarchaeota archaeon]|nr:CRISPR-associated endonuclease Cas2 [Candidatus Bathyarchaeota archaeon]RJS74472.1 MAG: CRISPR-associated endonuclease Cas2 [Candidatus Bathyarchaeota archaeon]